MEKQAEFIYDNLIRRLIQAAYRYRIVLISSIAAGILAYTFLFTNKLLNHDDIKCLFDLGTGRSSGRWMIDIMARLTITCSLPWLNGISSVFLLAAANCFIVSIFCIKRPVIQALLPAIIVVFPGQMDVFTYMFTITAYTFAFLLSVISAGLFRAALDKKRPIPAIAGCLICAAALAIYQAYLTVPATLLLLMLIKDALDEECRPLDTIRAGFLSLAFLIACVLLYFGLTYLVFSLTGDGFNSYSKEYIAAGQSLFQRISLVFNSFWLTLAGKNLNVVNSSYSGLAHILAYAAASLVLLVRMLRCRSALRAAILASAMLLLPLCMNSIYLFFRIDGIRAMMDFGFIGVYILVAMAADGMELSRRKLAGELLPWLMTLIIINNICIANKTAMRMHLAYENAYSFFTTVLADIKLTPGFDEDCRLALIGYTDICIYPLNEIGSDAVYGALKDIINVYSREWFIKYYLGFDIDFASAQEELALLEKEEFREMPRYPYYGSIQRIGDYIVVKLDEVPLA